METIENLQLDKSKTRLKFARLRDEFIKTQPHALSAIHSKIGQWLRQLICQFPQNATIASYRARGSEVPTKSFESIGAKFRWIYPRVQGNQLQFLKPKNFVQSPWGIDEPTEDSQKVPLNEVDMILIPGTAFDHRGHRLGTGKGFYDRTLTNYRGIKVGIAYALQVSSNDFAMETHDLPMEYVVTENYMLKHLKRL